jgi:hypothetical protein
MTYASWAHANRFYVGDGQRKNVSQLTNRAEELTRAFFAVFRTRSSFFRSSRLRGSSCAFCDTSSRLPLYRMSTVGSQWAYCFPTGFCSCICEMRRSTASITMSGRSLDM